MARLCALVLFVAPAALGKCPNYDQPPYCSGHGDCNTYGRCDCFPGFTAGDCSERTCPVGTAWADVATADDTAHGAAECSGRGHCDRATGRCECAVGFEGAACQRLTCQGTSDEGLPLACSGHGECLSMYDLARFEYDRFSRKFDYEAPWDAHMVYGCVCGADYAGPDCQERVCVNGDDPLTSGQVNEVQILSCVGEGDIVLRYGGAASEPIDSRAPAAAVERALEAIGRTIGDVVVTYTGTRDRLCYLSGDPAELMNVALVEFRTRFGVVPPLVYDEAESGFAGSVSTRAVSTHGDAAYLRASSTDYAYAVESTKEFEARSTGPAVATTRFCQKPCL